jgi:ferritin-like protein
MFNLLAFIIYYYHIDLFIVFTMNTSNSNSNTILQQDVKPSILPSGNQSTSNGRQMSYTEQEIFMLAQSYIRESCDSINGMSKKGDVFWKDIETLYETMRTNFNRSKIDSLSLTDQLFVSLPKRNLSSLRQQWSKNLQPAVNKFAGIHFRHELRSGETDQSYFERLLELYKGEVKSAKLKIPSCFRKYLKAYVWLRSQPKFGSHFEDNRRNSQDEEEVEFDADEIFDSSGNESPRTPPPPQSAKKARPRPAMGRDKSKKLQKAGRIAEEAAASVKSFISQTTESQQKETAQRWDAIQTAIATMSNTAQQFLELQAMNDAPEEERKRYFSLIRQRAILDAEIKLSQSHQQMQQLNATTTAAVADTNNNNDATTTAAVAAETNNNNEVTNNNDVDGNDINNHNSGGTEGMEGVPPFQV